MTSWNCLSKEDLEKDDVLERLARLSSGSDWAELSSALDETSKNELGLTVTAEMLFMSVLVFLISLFWSSAVMMISFFLIIGSLAAMLLVGSRSDEKRLELAGRVYEALAKHELRTGRRILPERLVAKNGILFISWMPRGRPAISGRDWSKIKWALRMDRDFPKWLFGLVGGTMAFAAIYNLGEWHLNPILVGVVVFLPFYTLFHIMWWPQSWKQAAFNIGEYEEITGERLIPDDIRSLYEAAKIEQARFQALRETQETVKAPLRQNEPPLEKIRQWKQESSR